MNKIQQKAKDWMISHFKHPEKMEDIDHKILDILVTVIPTFISQIIGWSIMTFLYIWLYNKYGFEKVIILLFINVIFAIGFVRKALTM